jgi:hypothetical protein
VAESLQEYVVQAERNGDAAAMCRLALYLEYTLGSADYARLMVLQAVALDHLPALHELARVSAALEDFDTALSALETLARAHRKGGHVLEPGDPLSPSPSKGLTPVWVMESSWSGERGWVSVAPDVLGKSFFGPVVPFDWEPADSDSMDGSSNSGEVLMVVTPEPDRAHAVLAPLVEDELMRTNWLGELVDPQSDGTPHIAYARSHERGVRVDFDMKGEVYAPMGRAVVRMLARVLNEHGIPAHIANGSPGWVSPYVSG